MCRKNSSIVSMTTVASPKYAHVALALQLAKRRARQVGEVDAELELGPRQSSRPAPAPARSRRASLGEHPSGGLGDDDVKAACALTSPPAHSPAPTQARSLVRFRHQEAREHVRRPSPRWHHQIDQRARHLGVHALRGTRPRPRHQAGIGAVQDQMRDALRMARGELDDDLPALRPAEQRGTSGPDRVEECA